MKLKLKPRYTLTALLTAISLIGLSMAWVRHKLDVREAYCKQLQEDFISRGIMVSYHAALPPHPWYGFFEDAKNPNQLSGVAFGGEQFGDDELRLFDSLPNLQEIEMQDTNITDEGLLYLARRHPNLTKVIVTGGKITRDGVARFRVERPGVPIQYER